MNAAAPGALAEQQIAGPTWAADRLAAGTHREVSLVPAARLRAALLGTALTALVLAAATATGLLIASGSFHTTLGSIA